MGYILELQRIMESINNGKPGVFIINCQHDNWCNLLRYGGECNCDSDIIVKDSERFLKEMGGGR